MEGILRDWIFLFSGLESHSSTLPDASSQRVFARKRNREFLIQDRLNYKAEP
jgi:hypothetical protein